MHTLTPPAYRRLLLTYPRAWRREHESVVLGTMLEADEAAGRSRPSRRDRMGFLLGGVLVRLPHRVRPSRAAPLPIVDATWHQFDRSNGFDRQREPTEGEQVRLNAVRDRNADLEGVTAMARMGWGGGAGNL